MVEKLSDRDIEKIRDIIKDGEDDFTDEDYVNLKEMIEDYKNAKWMRRQLKIWITWLLAAPVAVWAALEASSKLIKFIKG